MFSYKSVSHYLEKLIRLQDQLGRLNDLAVAEKLLNQLSDGQVDANRSLLFVMDQLKISMKQDQKAILKIWKKFKAVSLQPKPASQFRQMRLK